MQNALESVVFNTVRGHGRATAWTERGDTQHRHLSEKHELEWGIRTDVAVAGGPALVLTFLCAVQQASSSTP